MNAYIKDVTTQHDGGWQETSPYSTESMTESKHLCTSYVVPHHKPSTELIGSPGL